MKTKNIFSIVTLGLVLCFCATSCSDDFLDEKPYSAYAPETLGDAAGIEAMLKGLHYRFGQLWTWSDQQGWLCMWQVGTDVCSPGGVQGVEIPFFKYEDLNAENAGVAYMWSQGYLIINTANAALATIGEDGDPAKRAEALFFRGYMYNILATLYGDVPLLTEATTSATTDYTRTPIAQVNAQIVADLTYAADNLPDIAELVNESRAHKYMAMQTLGEVYLRIGDPGEAERVLTQVIDGPFTLVENRYGIEAGEPGDYFHDMFIYGNQRRAQGNTEAIWTYELEYNWNVGSGGFTNAPQHRRVWVPGYHNVPGMAYEVNGESEYGGRGNGRMRPSNWVKYRLYEEGDMRNSEYNITREFHYNAPDWSEEIGIDANGFRVPLEVDGEPNPDVVETRTVQTGDPVVLAAGDTVESMFPYTRKWDSFDPSDAWGWTCIKDLPMMRLGETYLLRAEARFKNSATAGAAEDVNVLRDRAFIQARIDEGDPTMGEVSAADINLDFILDERARELFAEENRRLTLMRTGTLIERAQMNTDETIKGKISGVTNRISLFPIPLNDILRNTDVELTQNDGYEIN